MSVSEKRRWSTGRRECDTHARSAQPVIISHSHKLIFERRANDPSAGCFRGNVSRQGGHDRRHGSRGKRSRLLCDARRTRYDDDSQRRHCDKVWKVSSRRRDAATAKASTAAFFSTTGNAFSTRTAGFIIQEHFPPGISFRAAAHCTASSSLLPCSDIKKPSARLGLSADPGGLPIYKNGLPAGGIGIEGDGLYTVDRDPTDNDQPFEELIAASGIRGFEAPALIRGDNILVDGIRLPFTNVTNPPVPTTTASITGAIISAAPASAFVPQVVGGIAGEVDLRFFPFIAGTAPSSNALTASDVGAIIARAAQQSNITRAAIRQPLGSNARVTIAVVDTAGVVLGVFRQQDAPIFGFDVAVQRPEQQRSSPAPTPQRLCAPPVLDLMSIARRLTGCDSTARSLSATARPVFFIARFFLTG